MSLPFGLKLKHSLKIHDVFHSLITKISDLVKQIPNHIDLKNEPELLLMVCNLVENMIYSNKYKIDKKDLCLCIMDDLYNLTDAERVSFSNQIQFMYDNGQIKKQPIYKLALHYAFDWITRKFL
jgi:hypothetical protein